MTAYKNRKAALAVTAGLVGALTLGGAAVAVPAAYAETGATAQSDWTTEVKVTEATNGKGVLVADPANASFPGRDGQYLVPTKAVNKFGVETSFTQKSDYVFNYYWQAPGATRWSVVVNDIENGDFSRADAFFGKKGLSLAGNYKVTVHPKSDPSQVVSANFKLTKPTVQGITVADSIMYAGYDSWNTVDLEVKDAHNKLVNGEDYEVVKVTKDGSNVGVSSPVTPGTYTVQVDGIKAYKGSSETKTVKVTPLDLAKASVSVPDQHLPLNVTGLNYDWIVKNLQVAGYNEGDASGEGFQQAEDFRVTGFKDAEGRSYNDLDHVSAPGVYTATIAGTSNGNVTGTIDVTFSIYKRSAGNLYYGQQQVADDYFSASKTGKLVIDTTAGNKFDAFNLKVKIAEGRTFSGDQLSISYSEGINKVDADALQAPGKYQVTVRVNPTTNKDNELVGGYYSFTVTVLGNKLNASNDVAFLFNGEQCEDALVTFDGTDQLANLAVMVKDSDGKVYEQGKDYDLTVKRDGWGDAVTEAVNAGTYKVTVTPKTFEFKGNATFTLTVSQAKISELVDQTITYAGKELDTPAPQYRDAEGNPVPMADDFYKFVSIKNSKGKVVKAMKDAGDYTVTVALTDKANGNYDLVDVDYTVTVKKAISFADVAVDAWYADPINKAFDNGYVNGFAGTNLFGPERQITRADAACILFNIAGGKDMSDDLFDRGPLGFETGFSDVAGNAYYAKALAWANETDVANGYSDGTFKPEAQITREEFAALLSNYAKLKGEYKAPTGDLSSFGDASSVSDWAKSAVAWAVENSVMGNGGFLAGQSHITRAEVAAMAVNYQPSPVKAPVYRD